MLSVVSQYIPCLDTFLTYPVKDKVHLSVGKSATVCGRVNDSYTSAFELSVRNSKANVYGQYVCSNCGSRGVVELAYRFAKLSSFRFRHYHCRNRFDQSCFSVRLIDRNSKLTRY